LVLLSPQDYDRLAALGEPLLDELRELVTSHAAKQRFSFGELIDIKLEPSSALLLGQLEVSSKAKKMDIVWLPVLVANGVVHELVGPRTTVGRDSTADIQIQDNGLSRKHFEILWDGKNAVVRDLGSTNGTKVAGKRIDSVALGTGASFLAGRTNFLFNVIARAK
jgi:hypothetical protein